MNASIVSCTQALFYYTRYFDDPKHTKILVRAHLFLSPFKFPQSMMLYRSDWSYFSTRSTKFSSVTLVRRPTLFLSFHTFSRLTTYASAVYEYTIEEWGNMEILGQLQW